MTNTLKNFYFFNIPIKLEFLIFFIPVISIFGIWQITGFYISILFLLFCSFSISGNITDLKIPYFLSWVFLLMWGIYIAGKSPNLSNGVYYYIGIILIPFFIYTIINNINVNYKFLDILFNLFIFSGVVLSIISFYVFADIGFDLKQRISSIWQDNNIVSLYLLILFLFNLSFLVNKKSNVSFFIHLISVFIILLGVVLTQTRGVYISLIFALSVFLVKRPKIIIPIAIVSGILILFFFKVFEDRFLSIRYFGSDVSSLGRLQAWLSTLILLSKNFFLGYGFNSYIYLRDQIFAFYFVEVQHSHNTYLRAMLEMGFIGFVFYFSFFFISLKFVFSKRAKELVEYKKFIDGLRLSFLACIPAFMFEPYLSLYGVSTIVLWIFVSITIKLKNLNNQ